MGTMRTLTLKSKMGFGKYSDYKVNDVLSVYKKPQYLRWIYYNMSHISFMPEILKEIDVINEINKPGKSPDLFVEDVKEYKILTVAEASYCKNKRTRKNKRMMVSVNMSESRTKERLRNDNNKL
jgi:hypothetical protein